MADIELMLEAERRGILPPDKVQLLDEARSRGLIQPKEVAKLQEKPVDSVIGTIGNLGAGAVSGAAQIGATLLSPIDYAAKKLGIQNEALFPKDRRAAIESGLREMGASPESTAFKAGQIGAEIAGTAGLPAALGGKVAMIAPKLGSAISSGGFGAGKTIANRALGGAIAGGASAGLVNPQEAGTGAAIGGAIPVAAKAITSAIPKILGATTGVGDTAISQAYKAGKNGGTAAESFAQNLRHDVPMTDVLDQARAALANMRTERGAMYRAGMEKIGQSQQPLDYSPVIKAAQSAMGIKRFKGESISPSTEGIQQKIAEQINRWGGLDPEQYHTAEGLDALKQSIGDIRDATQFGSPERKVADSVYHAIKAEIVKSDPKYALVMKDYETASGLIGEIEKALSLGNKASADTAMRKLQSLTRNNVSTNYGNRTALAGELESHGAHDMMNALAGQALGSWTPRGIQGISATGLGGLGIMTSNPAVVPLMAAASPRIAGEAAFATGKAARLMPKDNALLRAMMYQSGQAK